MTSPESASCEEVGRVSWALKKDYYYTIEMQSWYAKVCVLAGVDYWTRIYARSYGDIIINTSQSCLAKKEIIC